MFGEHRGLWKLLVDDRRKLAVDTPLLKSVCAVQSTANAYKDLCKSVPEIDHLVLKLAAISTYFHVSAKRTSELEKVAKVEGLTARRFPSILRSDGQNLQLLLMLFCARARHSYSST